MANRVVNFGGGEKLVERIALADIMLSHNPRRPAPGLHEKLLEIFPGEPVLAAAKKLALGTAEEKAKFVALVEETENQPRGLVELAESRRVKEIEPAMFRNFRTARKEGGYDTRYAIVVGERRVLAALYAHAKYGDKPTVGAISVKMTVEEADDLAFSENHQRKDMTEVETGVWLNKRFERVKAVDPAYTLKKLAEDLKMDYSYVRTREALAHLPAEEQARIEKGQANLTDGYMMGMQIKSGRLEVETVVEVGPDTEPTEKKVVSKASQTRLQERKNNRRRVKTLKEVEELFDASPATNLERRKALAEVMGLSLELAEAESLARKPVAQTA